MKKVYVEWVNLNELNKPKTKKIKKPLKPKLMKQKINNSKMLKGGKSNKADIYFDEIINRISDF